MIGSFTLSNAQTPVADFNATPTSGCSPLAVTFTDLSTGAPTTWQWDLGNGATSSQQNPTTTYFNPGQYTVTLTVSNANGSNTLTRTQYITVNDKPFVDFTASQTTGCFPLPVNFTDLSSPVTGTIVSWEWDFGDGSTSTLQNPSHVYTTAGNRTVILKVTNSAGCSRVFARPNYIQVSTGVVVNFANPQGSRCRPPDNIPFTNNTTGPGVLSYQWDFGDGNTSTLQNPVHTYLTGGLFNVTLIAVSSLGCRDTLTVNNAVRINSVVSSITGPDSVCLNRDAAFTNSSAPLPILSFWDFGDGTTSTQFNPVKRWNATGVFTVRLINAYATCADTAFKPIRVTPIPSANFDVPDSIDCDAPFTVNFNNLSTGAVSWQWNFGDGGTSNLQNPSHTYTSNGNYSVVLIATNASGCSDTFTRSQYIRIQRPIVNISGAPTEGCVPYVFAPFAVATAIDGVASYLWDFGDGSTSTLQNPVHVYPLQGNYTVKLQIITNDGCVDSIVIPNGVVVGTKSLADFSAAPLPQCARKPVQFTNLTAPSDRWLWEFGDANSSTVQNPIHTYMDTGFYSVQLIAWNNGCADTMIKPSYVQSLPPIARFTPVYSCTNKTLVSFTDNSTVPISWQWDFGDGNTSTVQNPVHNYGAFGNFTVRLITTNGGCSDTAIQTISLFSETVDFHPLDDTICKSEAALIVATVNNPLNIADYFWHFGDGQTLSTGVSGISGHYYSVAGSYTIKLVITDTHGCRDSVSKSNILRVWGADADFVVNTLIGCRPQTVIFNDQSVSDGVHPITSWIWDYGDGIRDTLFAPPFSHVYDTAGNFNIQLRIVDSYGCIDNHALSAPLNITDPRADFSVSVRQTCQNQPVVFRNTSSGSITNFRWDFGDGTIINGPFDSVVTKSWNADGFYDVTLIVTDINGCLDTLHQPNFIDIKTSRASFTLQDSISSCSPFEVNFTSTSINTLAYQWNFGDGSSSTQASPTYYYTTPGIYQVELITTGPGGCTDTARNTIELYSSAATLTYAPLAGCSPLPVSFQIRTAGPVTYLWDLNDGNTLNTNDSNLTHTYVLPGNFVPRVIMEDQTGCQIPVIGIDTIKITKSYVNFGQSDSSICGSALISFSDSTVANAAITGFQWDFGDGSVSTLQNPTHLYNVPGLYTVRLVVSTANGCTDSLVKPNLIKVSPIPAGVFSGPISACEPALLNFSGTVSNPDTSTLYWQWTFGNGNSSVVPNPPAQPYDTAGTYNLQLIITNSSGCADTIPRTITIHPLPTTDAGNDTTLCLATPLQLNATGADNYSWTPAATLSCSNCSNPFSNTTIDTWYYVTGSTLFGCVTTDSVFVKVNRPINLQLNINTDSICIGESVRLIASAAENYLWTPAVGLSNTAIANPIASPTTTTTYKLEAFDNANCFRDSAFVTISVFDYPTVDAGPDRTISAGQSLTFNPVYSNDVSNWLWQSSSNLGNISCTGCPSPVVQPGENTTYSITVRNSNGCASRDEVKVFVLCNNGNVFIPNTFSPNGDGLNDVFYPRGTGLFRIQRMEIYNRWGQMVFQNANFTPNSVSEGWNGTYKGKIMPIDSYVYIIEVICTNSTILTYRGNITLIQ